MKMIKQMMVAAVLLGCMYGFAGTMTVKGNGLVRRRPDGMRLEFTINAIDKDMVKSKTMFAEKHAKIKTALSEVGISEGELTDSNFQMCPEYHNEDKDGNVIFGYGGERGKRVFDGYRHTLKCELKAKLDMERLEKMYVALVRTTCVENLRIDFYLIDSKSASAEARRLAVMNARTVADELCQAASATLGSVQKIDYDAYNYDRTPYCVPAASHDPAPRNGDVSLFPSIVVEDIAFNDTVAVSWEIQ